MPGQIHAWVLIVAWLPVSRKVDMYPKKPNNPPPIRLKTVRFDGNQTHVEMTYYKETRHGAKQKPPFDLDLPYIRVSGLSRGGVHDVASGPQKTAYELDLESAAVNQCRSKFMSMASDPSQYGSSLTTELGQTYRTIVGGISTALRAARAVAKGDLLEAGRLLKFNPPVQTQRIRLSRPRRKPSTLRQEASRRLAAAKRPRSSRAGKPKKRAVYVYRQVWVMPDRRRVAAGLGNRWLWYSYGVSPLISDLHAASRTLTKDFGTVRIEAGSSRKGSRTTRNNATRWDTKVSTRLRADVRISNPNLYLASQLGLINPAQWLNEGVRFSFVIDWFSNWSDWLGQLTDRAGMEMTNILLTTKVRQHYSAKNYGPTVFVSDDWELFSFTRSVGAFPPVKLRFEYETPNWRRGLNAISLLLIQLRKPKGR